MKTPRVGWCKEGITRWHQAEESDAEGGGFRRLLPASDLPTRTTRRAGVFLLYRTYLWNKQQVMSINLTMWSTMQYHVVVDHVVFYVIHSQVRYNGYYLIRFWRCFVRNCYFGKVSLKIRVCAFKVKHYSGHISGMVDPIDVKRRGSVLVEYWE